MFTKSFEKILLSMVAVLFFMGVVSVVTALPAKAYAAASSNIGVVDFAMLVDQHPDMAKANEAYKAELETAKKEFESKSASLSDKEKLELDRQLWQRAEQKRRELLSDIISKINAVIKEVADAKGLPIVIDKTAVVYGGQDITTDVGKKITGK